MKAFLLAGSITLLIGVSLIWIFRSKIVGSDFYAQQQYHDSDEVIEPYEIAKNPYILKGHSGILDTVHVSVRMPNGARVPIPYPGGGLRFEKMIDDRTATYEVLSGQLDSRVTIRRHQRLPRRTLLPVN